MRIRLFRSKPNVNPMLPRIVDVEEVDYTDVLGTDAQLPHCDSLILHRPGTCEFCDRHPAWQQYRSAAGIAFSNDTDDHIREHGLAPCPSTFRRTSEVRDKWPGNVPTSARFHPGGFIGHDEQQGRA
jgi:hypothetical protein